MAYAWSVSSGSLPSGLSLSSSGKITGTPSGTPGISSVVLQVTDGVSTVLSRTLKIYVFSDTVSYLWEADTLPSGFTLNSVTGEVSR